ncbi:MAG: anhydro-N-acetylmuramic acid kinase [Candidatus Poribacteria bacterium]|nr:MAG: anhydro-N-acetylmuramic acid kinase [Candidatus Poribacteria bacterium]
MSEGPLGRLERRAWEPEGLYLGLMSGTSADGVDAALVRLSDRPDGGLDLRLEGFQTVPYPDPVQEALARLSTGGGPEAISWLHAAIGEAFGEAAEALLRERGVPAERVVAIGSHGQTVWHAPPSSGATLPHTLQLGQPHRIALRTGIPVVADFRSADLALGGEGAPLVPYFDWKLFTDAYEGRFVLNLGGIANGTYLPPGAQQEQVLAFDTGPGNALIDAAMVLTTAGRERYDRDGRCAAEGRVDPELLERWMAHSFFRRRPPKSTGREVFGLPFVQSCWEEAKARGRSDADLIATLTALTAHTIAEASARFLGRLDRVILSGGGVHNLTLCRMLREAFQQRGLCPSWALSDAFGVPADAKEAIAFALFAREFLRGVPVGLPLVTGARRSVRLGLLVLPD